VRDGILPAESDRDDTAQRGTDRQHGARDEGVVGVEHVGDDLGAERDEHRADREAERDRQRGDGEDPADRARHVDRTRTPCRKRLVAHVTRQEQSGGGDDHDHAEQHPERQGTRRGTVLHERAADDGGERQSDGDRHGVDGARPVALAVQFDECRAGGTERQSDAEALEEAPHEEPLRVRRECEDEHADEDRGEAEQDRRAPSDVVGEIPEQKERDDEHDGVDGEDRGRHGGGELPYPLIQRVHHRGRPARPERDDDDGGGRPEREAGAPAGADILGGGCCLDCSHALVLS
jgi:hypothetical protein